MTLALDTSALLARYLEGAARSSVLEAMGADSDWCASALALSEALMLVDRLGDDPGRTDAMRRAMRDDWERVHVVPVDAMCLERAAELGRTQPLPDRGCTAPGSSGPPSTPGHLRHLRSRPDPGCHGSRVQRAQHPCVTSARGAPEPRRRPGFGRLAR
ncbi:MAG: PIN domain-containing protein [Microthrixaceae bacterium]|nr:PIN domain-containing protein [Microthrixaceae bacterium]